MRRSPAKATIGERNNMDWKYRLAGLLVFGIASVDIWRQYRGRFMPENELYRTFAPRFLAGPVDAFVLLALYFGIDYLHTLDLSRLSQVLLLIAEGTLAVVYTIVLHASCGQTVGKMICKVRVVGVKTEKKISIKQAIIRESIPLVCCLCIVAYVSIDILNGKTSIQALKARFPFEIGNYDLLKSIPVVWFLVEVLTIPANRKHRALHDLIAGTLVHRTNVFKIDSPISPHRVAR